MRVVGAGVATGLGASGSGSIAAALAALGTGASGSGCFLAGAGLSGLNGGLVDTGLQQATVQFSCVDSGAGGCVYEYDVRTSCSAATVPATSFVRQVCFQAYNNASCGAAVGPKQCSPENRCTHVDYNGVNDESTLQVCQAGGSNGAGGIGGYVHIDLYRNTSSCRAEKKVYGYNTTLGVCAQVAPQYFGIVTCGAFCCVGVRGGCLCGWWGWGWGWCGGGGVVGCTHALLCFFNQH